MSAGARLLLALFAVARALEGPAEGLLSGSRCALLYEKGVEAYLANDFAECARSFEEAVEEHRRYSRTLNNCRIECKDETKRDRDVAEEDVDDLGFYEDVLKRTLCFLNCRNRQFVFGEFNLNEATEDLFESKKPYEYLQLCYFQTKEYQKCASAAFTYLVEHPEDEVMLKNLKYYSDLPEVDVKEIINFEAKDYVYLYAHGSNAYTNKDWKAVIGNMEESLLSYLHEEEYCRANCEGPFNQGWFPDFIPSIANHFTFCLRCKRTCPEKLSSLNGEKHEDLFASHYHYLQYAYFKLDRLKEACEATESYLLFYPEDKVMIANKNYYLSLDGVKEKWFKPRREAEEYYKRDKYEKKIIKFVMKEFHGPEDQKDPKPKASGKEIKIVRTASELNGTRRYLADNLLDEFECKSLVRLTKLFALPGDGYVGNSSPHTSKESFEGVALSRTSSLARAGLLSPEDLRLLLKASETAKNHVRDFFDLPFELYFAYTHLVCRTAIPGSSLNRTDFSHSVHADNCNLKVDMQCEKAYPSYTYRDYSAVIYLNDDFEGGDFVFVSDFYGKQLESSVKPKCGRMVAFSSGSENLHAVKAVTKGSRCALAVWFTFDRKYSENRSFADQILEKI